MKKICCMCKEEKDVSEFKTNKRKKDGLQSQCISCQKKYRREHYEENRKKYIEKAKKWKQGRVEWWREYKAKFKCSICGESHVACIDFHHPNDDKEETVSTLIAKASMKRIMSEISKCIPVCSNCHRKIHYDMRK